MTTDHLTDRDIDRYRRREMPPADLLRLGDHIADCAECRDRLRVGRDRDHLTEDQLQACVDGNLEAIEQLAVTSHLERCAQCRREVQDLREFAAHWKPPRPHWYRYGAIAAAVAVAALGALWMRGDRKDRQPLFALRDSSGMVSLDRSGRLSGLESLPREQRELVASALRDGRVAIPSSLRDLTGRPEQLMGSAEPAAFRLLSPAGTAVLSDRPTLRWSALDGAKYTATLQDETTGTALSSEGLRDTSWIPPQPLSRGHTYVWQVTAMRGGRETIAPRPPEPPVRFLVVDAVTSSRLEALPQSSLARGILFAQAGLLDDAAMELSKLAEQNPESQTVRSLVRSLSEARQ